MSDQGSADRFDTELFIDEIEKCPAIWDIACADYKDRVVKKRCWEELVDLFYSGDEQEKKVGKWNEHFINQCYSSSCIVLSQKSINCK